MTPRTKKPATKIVPKTVAGRVRRALPTQFMLYAYDLEFLESAAERRDRSVLVDAALSLLKRLPEAKLKQEIEAARARRRAAQYAE